MLQADPVGPSARGVAAAGAGPLTLGDVRSRVTGDGGRRIDATLHDPVEPTGCRQLWFEVSAEAGLGDVERADAFFPIALLAAMRRGRTLRVEAPLSPQLLYHATHYLQAVLHRLHPPSVPVAIEAPRPEPPPTPPDRGVCCGFSGGIDSFALLDEQRFAATVPGFALTHLLFNSVGSHHPRDPEAVFARRLARVRALAGELGMPLIVTRSNQDEILGRDYQQFHPVRNAAVALLLAGRMRRFYYGSGYHFGHLGVRHDHDAAIADPVLLPLLSTEAIELLSSGCQETRVEKTARLTAHPLVPRYLDVCQNSPSEMVNCGHCEKCTRTLLTLEVLGEDLEAYAALFDLEAYARKRPTAIVSTLVSRDLFAGEIRDAMARYGFAMPAHLRAKAALGRLPLRGVLPAAHRRRLRRWLGV